ncbi:MAG: hypothetical protein K2K91_04630 [Ruminococcus sp.]|nr:hypothetical protein [Ruminococcus sp.]
MKKKSTAIFAFMAVLALSIVSCGNEPAEESSVTLDLPVATTTTAESERDAEETTEITTEKTTKTKETKTTAESEETTTETAESTIESATETTAEPATEAPVEVTTEAPATEPPTDAPPVVSNVQFSMDMLKNNADGVVSSLGSPVDVQSAQGCLSNGADQKIYVYEGLTIKCYVMDGTEYIYEIDIISGNYSLSSGITVGSSKADVESAYGTGEESGQYLTYYNDNNTLEKSIDFQIADDIVQSIVLYTAV